MAKKWIGQESLCLTVKGEERRKEIFGKLLKLRGIGSKKEAEEFLNPSNPAEIKLADFGIDKAEVKKAVARIKKAIRDKEEVVIYGDYDADGVTATVVLWEVLYRLGVKVIPYIGKREEGYGLNKVGISRIKKKKPNVSLVITVDNGIVADKGIEFCYEKGIEVVITDHHVCEKKVPPCVACVHTTKTSGSGVAWVLARETVKAFSKKKAIDIESYLDVAAIGVIADLIPLVGVNRSLVKYGLERLNKTKRLGLLELVSEAGLESGSLGVYEVGYIIGPRLNAMGRLGEAMDSLRLLCTRDAKKAKEMAKILGDKNRVRQDLTEKTTKNAIGKIKKMRGIDKKKILFVSDSDFNPGIIGLVAGRIVDCFYKPAIVISEDKICKGSARSISGIDIIRLMRKFKEQLTDCGGHKMAAGFSIKKGKIAEFKRKIEKEAEKFADSLFERKLKIDLQLNFSDINYLLLAILKKFEPFGIGNCQPVFVTRGVKVVDKKLVGRNGGHLKMKLDDLATKKIEKIDSELLSPTESFSYMDTIGFGLGNLGADIRLGDKLDVAYTVSENVWNGKKNLQLKIKDIRRAASS